MSKTANIASFDIGYRNFAFCIELIDVDKLHKIKNIPFKHRYTKEGLATLEFKKILKEVYLSGKIILEKNICLSRDQNYDLKEICIEMVKVLDEIKNYLDDCSTILIEQQMAFGRNKNNVKALKIAQHLYSYFIFNYSVYKEVIEFPSYNKTKILGAPKKLKKPERKKWAETMYSEILKLRGDTVSLESQNTRKKKDDVADTCCQLQAFKYMVFVDKKLS